MGCEYAEKVKESLRLSECGLRGMSCELRESYNTRKMASKLEVSEGVGCVHGLCAYAFIVEFREVLINKSPRM